MKSHTEELLELDPYSLSQKEKNVIFHNAMNESIKFHY